MLRRDGDGRFDASRYRVAALPHAEAKDFVLTHHYSGSFPAAVASYGILDGSEIMGVATYSVPVSNAAITNVFGANSRGVELGRFVLREAMPFNSETYFLSRANRLLKRDRPDTQGVIAFSDPLPRRTPDGDVLSPGHIGGIYQANNATYVGRSSKRTIQISRASGFVLHARTLQKIRSGDTGWAGAVEHLVSLGATEPRCLTEGQADPLELKQWLPQQLTRIADPVRHPGNLKYAWALARGATTPQGQPYPKRMAA